MLHGPHHRSGDEDRQDDRDGKGQHQRNQQRAQHLAEDGIAQRRGDFVRHRGHHFQLIAPVEQRSRGVQPVFAVGVELAAEGVVEAYRTNGVKQVIARQGAARIVQHLAALLVDQQDARIGAIIHVLQAAHDLFGRHVVLQRGANQALDDARFQRQAACHQAFLRGRLAQQEQ